MVVFGIPGTVNVQYEAVQSVIMDANPVPGNELNACTSVTNGVIMDIFSTGSLFSALRANSFLLFEDQVPVLRPVRGCSKVAYMLSLLFSCVSLKNWALRRQLLAGQGHRWAKGMPPTVLPPPQLRQFR